MYKSKLFSPEHGLSKPSTSLWTGERDRSFHADIFNMNSSLLVDSLIDTDEDKLNALKQEVSDFEKSIVEATSEPAVARLLQKHDMYELAQRMTTRLRVLISSNHQLAHELSYKQQLMDEKVLQLEQDIVEW